MDDAALDRYAEAAWTLRCERSAEAKERPPITVPWKDRAPFLREIDKAVVRLVADMAVAEVCGRIARTCQERGGNFPPGDDRGTVWLSAGAVALAARERGDEEPQP
jgi:hypothetical protein